MAVKKWSAIYYLFFICSGIFSNYLIEGGMVNEAWMAVIKCTGRGDQIVRDNLKEDVMSSHQFVMRDKQNHGISNSLRGIDKKILLKTVQVPMQHIGIGIVYILYIGIVYKTIKAMYF